VNFEDYLQLDRVHVTGLKRLRQSPRHFLVDETNRQALIVGRATHMLTFEPKKAAVEIAVWPERLGSRRGKVWEAWRAERDGKTILTEREYEEEAKPVADAVRAACPDLLADGEAEKTILWTDAKTGLECKGRIDWLARTGMADLKTCRCAAPREFGRQAWDLGYHLQAAHYRRGYAATHSGLLLPFLFIAAEKKKPWVVQVYETPAEVIELAEAELDELMARLVELRGRPVREWPGYADGPLPLQLPAWAFGSESSDVEDLGLDLEGVEEAKDE